MRFVSFNVNSLRRRQHQLTRLIEAHQPFAIGLQETKVADEEFPHDMMADLDCRADYHGQKTHYGVAVLQHGNRHLQPASVQLGYPWETDAAQKRFMAIDWPLVDGRTLRLVNAYFPQGESRNHEQKFPAKEAFYADMLRYLQQHCDPRDPLLLMGDMNVAPEDTDIGIGEENSRRWLRTGKCSFLPEERQWLQRLTEWGLQDSFRQHHPQRDDLFSWFDYRSGGFERTPRRGLRIDLILASQPMRELCTHAGIDYPIRAMDKPSDHCPVWADFAIEPLLKQE